MRLIKTKRRQEEEIEENNFIKATSYYFEQYDEIKAKEIKEEQMYYFKKAEEIAKLSNMYHKHGSCIVYKNKIISIANNYHPKYLKDSYSIHAEVACILNLKKNRRKILEECELYIIRLSPIDNIFKYSKPCKNCTNFINQYNIKKIYYSTNYEYDNYDCTNN